MAPFFFSIHREHFIRACVCVWRLLFSCAECGVPVGCAVCARAARSEMPGFGIRARGRARWVGEYFSMHLIVHRAKLKTHKATSLRVSS